MRSDTKRSEIATLQHITTINQSTNQPTIDEFESKQDNKEDLYQGNGKKGNDEESQRQQEAQVAKVEQTRPSIE
jgi:hypothetical protein